MSAKYCKYRGYTARPIIPLCGKCTPESLVVPFSEAGAVPESVRMERRCPLYTVPSGTSDSPCISNPGRIQVPSKAPVPVETRSASSYTELLRRQTIEVATDPTNPATRFEQYFRPLPPQPADLVIGPERLPNKDPIRPDPPCTGFSRFAGSTPGVN